MKHPVIHLVSLSFCPCACAGVCVFLCVQARWRRTRETIYYLSMWMSSGGSPTCGATCSLTSSTTSPHCWSRWSSTRSSPWWDGCTRMHRTHAHTFLAAACSALAFFLLVRPFNHARFPWLHFLQGRLLLLVIVISFAAADCTHGVCRSKR